MRASELGIVVGANVGSMDDLEQGFHFSGHHDDRPPHSTEYLHQKVNPKLDERPWLSILAQFLDPNEKNFAIPQERRRSSFNLEVVNILASGDVSPPISCRTEKAFHDALKTGDEGYGTVVIAEDISCAMIDALGTRFDIEPEFFACHLVGVEQFRMGSWEPDVPAARTPHALSKYLRNAPSYTLRLRRPHYIEGGLDTVMNLRRTTTNTPRGAHNLNWDLPDIFVTEKISVYKRKGSNFAIILTDKPLTRDLPSSYMRDIITLPDKDTENLPSVRKGQRLSAQEELLSWVQRLEPGDARTLFDDQKQIALRPIMNIVEKSCVMFLSHVRHNMTRINVGQTDKTFPNSIPFFLRASRNLEGHLHDQLEILTSSSRLAVLRGGESMAQEVQDFKYIIEDMEMALRALEEDVRFIVFAASMNEGKIVGWITKFAALFLPLSLLAAILAIPEGNTRFIVLGALGVPFVLASTWLMYYWKPSEVDTLRF